VWTDCQRNPVTRCGKGLKNPSPPPPLPRPPLLRPRPTGAAAPVGVAAVHRPGAEDRGHQQALQAQERGQPPQLPQPLRPPAQQRQVIGSEESDGRCVFVCFFSLRKLTFRTSSVHLRAQHPVRGHRGLHQAGEQLHAGGAGRRAQQALRQIRRHRQGEREREREREPGDHNDGRFEPGNP